MLSVVPSESRVVLIFSKKVIQFFKLNNFFDEGIPGCIPEFAQKKGKDFERL